MKVFDFIETFFDEEEDAYVKTDAEINQAVTEKFGYDAQVQTEHCGGFESPGYDIDCYALAFIDEDGKLQLVSWEKERY